MATSSAVYAASTKALERRDLYARRRIRMDSSRVLGTKVDPALASLPFRGTPGFTHGRSCVGLFRQGTSY